MSIKHTIIFLIAFFLGASASAKITCDFVADTTKACAPKQISFTDHSTSTLGNITYWSWSFGNGGFSTLKNPSRVYTTPGVYTVTLTVSDGTDTCVVTKTAYLTLFKSPKADFTALTISKCIPVEVNFTDKTTLGDAPIKTYKWDYGDLSTPGSGKNSNHKYNFPGTYSVVFTVIDTNGCVSTSAPYNVPVGAPKANFTGTPRDDCLPPLKTTFTNLSTSRAPTTYSWLFGDGNTSTSKDPFNNYTKSGSYDVTLIVTDKHGCKDTITRKKYVNIGTVKADFEIPDTLCINSIDTIKNLSVGGKTFKWDFGNGSSSAQRDPLVSFPKEGYYTIKLKAISDTSCVDSISKVIYVENIEAKFNIIIKDICKPNIVDFTDSSIGNIFSVQYHLDMGSGLSHVYSNKKNFTHGYPVSYCFKSRWRVNYSVRSKSGCKSTQTKYVEIFNDQLTGKVIATSNCIPADFTFDATACTRFPLVKWKWDFNTGNPADTSNLKTPLNVIRKTVAGRYLAKVTVTDSNGCKYSHNVPYEVGEKQKADFTMDKDTLCYKDTVQFTNLSTDKAKIDSYNWSFGDGFYSIDTHPKHPYLSLGKKRVNLVVWNYTCPDSISKYLYVSGPISSIVSAGDCKDPLKQTFGLGIAGYYNRFYWDFGDSTGIDSVNKTILHNFKHYVPYKVKLIAYNDTTGCVDSSIYTLKPSLLKADFKINKYLFCRGDEAYFDATGSKGSIGGRYFWDFGDGFTDRYITRPRHRYIKSGKFTIRLIVVSADSCRDTTSQTIIVTSPNSNFSISQPTICSGDSLSILNTSTPDTNIYLYQWYFGASLLSTDSSLKYKFSIPASSIDSTLLINSDSSYIRLYMVDVLGCRDEKRLPLKVVHLRAVYEITDTSLCRGDEISFIDSRLPSIISHKWIFGDGDSSIINEPKYKYLKSGTFQSKYVVYQAPCSDTMTIPISVQGVDSVGFTASLRDTNCYPATIFFNNFAKGDSIIWRTWDFGDGIASIRSPLKDSLTKTFLTPGIFDIKVIVETSHGCKDSITYNKHIEIRGPYSRFSAYPDSICKYDEITFIHDTSNQYTHSLIWDFADGRVDSTGTNVDSVIHNYSRTGSLLAILLFKDSAGECKKFFTQEVVVEDVKADFDFNKDSIGCEPFSTNFLDKSIDGNNWSWIFGDGNISSLQNPGNTYLKDGKYPITLIYSNTLNGCKDTVVNEIVVLPLPIVIGDGDTTICVGDTAQLFASGAITYEWSPDYNISNTKIENPKVAPEEYYEYIVVGTDSNNCKNNDKVEVSIQKVPTVTLPADQILIIGEEFNIVPKTEFGTIYRWDPPEGLSCSDCPNPTAKPLENTIYTLYVKDSLGCFEVKTSFSI